MRAQKDYIISQKDNELVLLRAELNSLRMNGPASNTPYTNTYTNTHTNTYTRGAGAAAPSGNAGASGPLGPIARFVRRMSSDWE